MTVILSCSSLKEYVDAAQKAMGTDWPVVVVDRSHHAEPDEMKQVVKETIEEIIRKHGLIHYHEQNPDQPAESRVEWIMIARSEDVIERYLALRAEGYSPMVSLEPFSALLGYNPAESVHTGYDAYREFFPME